MTQGGDAEDSNVKEVHMKFFSLEGKTDNVT
jgi:hypothetical protein